MPLSSEEVVSTLWQGLLVFLGAAVLLASVYLLVYWLSWGARPHWMEAFRHRYKLWNLPDNRFWPWIHQDTQYWIIRLRFDRGRLPAVGRDRAGRGWNHDPAG